jgi:hypothetical protein
MLWRESERHILLFMVMVLHELSSYVIDVCMCVHLHVLVYTGESRGEDGVVIIIVSVC